jgi:hypothetical protein
MRRIKLYNSKSIKLVFINDISSVSLAFRLFECLTELSSKLLLVVGLRRQLVRIGELLNEILLLVIIKGASCVYLVILLLHVVHLLCSKRRLLWQWGSQIWLKRGGRLAKT